MLSNENCIVKSSLIVPETEREDPSTLDAKSEHLLHLLDSEINQIVYQEKKPGWTTWVLYASIATLFWILLVQLDPLTFNLSNVLILLLVLSLITDLIKILPEIFTLTGESPLRDTRFFYISRVFEGERLFLFLLALRFLIILLLIQKFSYVLNNYSYTLISVLYFFYTLLFVILLILSFLKIPLPSASGKQNKLKLLLMLLPFLMTIYTLSHYYFYLKNNTPSINDLKIGFIVTALIYLIILLSSRKSNTPLLSSLIAIRRNFSLNKISYEEAIKQTDIALLGLQINDVLQGNVKRILDVFENINLESDDMIKKVKVFKNELPSDPKDMTDEKRLVLDTVFKSFSPQLDKIRDLLDVGNKAADRFNWKLILLNIKKHQPAEIQEIKEKIKREIDKFRTNFEEASEGIKFLEKALCSSCPKPCSRKEKLIDNEK